MTALLRISNLSKTFGGLAAVSGVNLEIREGEMLSLIGPNGAGKTTLFNLITGYLPANDGEIHYKEQLISGLKPYQIAQRGVVRTFQKTNVFSGLTVLENVVTGHYLRARMSYWRTWFRGQVVRAREQEVLESSKAIIDFLEISHRRDWEAGNLPYGELRMLEIAIALAAGPQLLLLDEPAAGLNTEEAHRLVVLLKRIISEKKLTIFLVEHNMSVVMEVSDRVAVVNFGQMIAEGKPEEVQRNAQVIEAYLGTQKQSPGGNG